MKLSVPVETEPKGYWYNCLLEFRSFADLVKKAYPGQYTEVPGAVMLEFDKDYHGLHSQNNQASSET